MESAANITVAYFFSIQRKNIPFAFWSMAIDRLRSRKFTGISFSKLLGTGTGATFTPSDADVLQWGMVVVIDKNRLAAFDESSIIKSWRKRSTSEFRAVMSPISSHGQWSKREPFSPTNTLSSPDAQIAAITRARIKWNHNVRFWKAVPPVVSDLHSAPGLITAIGIGEAPIGLQGTFSIWESSKAIRDFAYKGQAHQEAIRQTTEIGWYSEELFARFEILETRGSIIKKVAN
ncbi:MAG: hypothetical protein RL466_711 [Actinomycetota bacterium]|jgi:hypothetical protein